MIVVIAAGIIALVTVRVTLTMTKRHHQNRGAVDALGTNARS